VMLNAFVVGDRVVLERAKRDDNKRGDQDQGRDIIDIGARQSSDLPAPGQCVLHAAGHALPTWLRVGHYHLTPGTVPAAASPKSPEKIRLMDAPAFPRSASYSLSHGFDSGEIRFCICNIGPLPILVPGPLADINAATPNVRSTRRPAQLRNYRDSAFNYTPRFGKSHSLTAYRFERPRSAHIERDEGSAMALDRAETSYPAVPAWSQTHQAKQAKSHRTYRTLMG
jgi:hypothetical protein